MGVKDEKGARWLNSPGPGYGFEEELVDLVELNGYRVVKTTRSDDGGSEMIAIRTDEVGQKIIYVIYYQKSDCPVDEAEVERVIDAREKHPGSISVVVSPYSGFSRSAADLAERRGVRLWGTGEIERLRRNVAEKRGLRRRETVESDLRNAGKKRGSKAALVAVLFILSIAAFYIKIYGLGTDSFARLLQDLRIFVEESGLRDLNPEEIYRPTTSEFREVTRNLYEKISAAVRGLQKA
ncbi:MAG: restriction endonuclease [Euryarchaeota archaeon]|jgi:hypothetical protein|nr:MAG: hypothetical protein APR56_11730 [Methanosaeta sp. SDB]MDD3709091.1 restriction endonuclease [Methanothrix sp.]MDI9400284.1 restriction endonuclease [Euryarchaeota archaeon]